VSYSVTLSRRHEIANVFNTPLLFNLKLKSDYKKASLKQFEDIPPSTQSQQRLLTRFFRIESNSNETK